MGKESVIPMTEVESEMKRIKPLKPSSYFVHHQV